MRYPIVIHKDSDSDYGVTVPDLPGCFSAGDSIEDVVACAIEAIECHIEGLLIDGEDIPLPNPIEEHRENPDFADAFAWMFVDIDLSKLSGKSKRINVTIPERILSRIDAFAVSRHESRSGLMANAAIEYMAMRSESPPDSKVEIAS
ncbi:type II toxin-antitoxin system HicB family antitoxin [Romeria aff. gracilis LEGE 07310]|uniref:Type II toxin-antitoxin system HicB family antitoxin n=1 Tax=Vasconcelosia minhoensis LEGE 07310 TaxID=915328 RepID=A0A8J7ADI0_9CYAN|nr:type II toxin-antitoxin system HicB family antitoxin [Romeria gracilis]MBE9077504.1 type II toxin-antitoxin system HicB family antitoxin [Romeria aff. gracilis LEGE 07310]